ncbi:5-carboxymethyl-2-hydroxymuconate Delta-isomerase [Vibrio sonorensis]|uniref:5-carboxymethyl-2-hydroxymuconate Delta-isomerase n=1 Tax=Vibrio sonorensis TaxID=1004316 RepID=UPI0008D97588|nr:5-carboxymethyl-2-hydroxymuconate Delta-isomerase [Vibrio sonorensis]
MPHCIVEHSSQLTARCKPEHILNAVYQGALNSGLFEGPDIKTRLQPFYHAWTKNQHGEFIHVVVKILTGRDRDQKKALSNMVLKELETLGLSHLSLTVEIVDIDTASYSKKVID